MKQEQFLASHDIGQSVLLGSSIMKEHKLGEELLAEPCLVEEYCEASDAISNMQHFPKREKVGVLTISLLSRSVELSEPMSPQVEQRRSG